MRLAQWSCVALMASGVAGVLIPERVGQALDLPPTTSRGRAETRAGLGGTYAALGGWALAANNPAVDRAVGATWLGAAAARWFSQRVDRPDTDWTYWAYLGAEIGLGGAALLSRPRRKQRNQGSSL